MPRRKKKKREINERKMERNESYDTGLIVWRMATTAAAEKQHSDHRLPTLHFPFYMGS